MTTRCDLMHGLPCRAGFLGPSPSPSPPARVGAAPGGRITTRRFGRDQEIFGEGDAVGDVYEVISGTVRSYKLLGDGRRQIDAFHLPGDLFGIEAGAEHRFSAEAVGDVTVRVFRWKGLGRLAFEDLDAAGRVMDAMARALGQARDHMLLLGRKCALEKVASFLLGLVDRSREVGIVELPMSRTDIADHLGLTIETVSRTLTDLRRRGIIALPTTRRTIVLKDLDALRALELGDADERPIRIARPAGPPSLLAH